MKAFVSEAGAGDLRSQTNGVYAALDYRAYILDGEGGIEDVRLIEATVDSEARKEAKSLGFKGQIELWCGNRLVSCRGFTQIKRPAQGDPFHNSPFRQLDDRAEH